MLPVCDGSLGRRPAPHLTVGRRSGSQRQGLSERRGRIWNQWTGQEKETHGCLGHWKPDPFFPPSCLVAQPCLDSFEALRTAAPPGSSSMGFSRQGLWIGLPFPSPGYLPHPGIESASPALAGGFFTTKPTREASFFLVMCQTKQDTAKGWCQRLTFNESFKTVSQPYLNE